MSKSIDSLKYEIKQANSEMNTSLLDYRKRQGKQTEVFHYINENRLLNKMATGSSKNHRSSLDTKGLMLLKDVILENIKLLDSDLSYVERKEKLSEFSSKHSFKI